MSGLNPQIGGWYEYQSVNAIFEIVAMDEDNGTIEIQYESGEIDEIEYEDWQEMGFAPAAPPVDTLAVYDLSSDDHWDDDSGTQDPLADDPLHFAMDTYADFSGF